jgi:hypothetical protein
MTATPRMAVAMLILYTATSTCEIADATIGVSAPSSDVRQICRRSISPLGKLTALAQAAPRPLGLVAEEPPTRRPLN